MRFEQNLWDGQGRIDFSKSALGQDANLVLYFGNRSVLEANQVFQDFRGFYKNAIIMGCSSGGEISDNEVTTDKVAWVAIHMEHTRIQGHQLEINDSHDSFEVGAALSKALAGEGLKSIFVLSDGLKVNGSELVRGLSSDMGPDISITGGLAGDDARFAKTLVGMNQEPQEGIIGAVGFYGDRVEVKYSSFGGWEPFGPQRIITKSCRNVLYELDGKPALDLYKMYLKEEAKNLPGSGLLFPLRIHPKNFPEKALVRTILAIDEETKSMTFAGNVPEGFTAQLMLSNLDKLVDGAAKAAEGSMPEQGTSEKSLGILISCIGRRLLLGQRIGDEVEAMENIWAGTMGGKIGFYSYGEISPFSATGLCELHNQTMTVTVLREKE